MRKSFILISLLTVLLLGTGAGLSSEYDDIQVLRSDAEGIIFQYKPSSFFEEEKIIDNQIFHKVQIGQCPLTQSPGEPELPVRIVMLGVPLGCKVVATVLDSDYSDLSGFNITPVPAYQESKDPLDNEALYKKDEKIYFQDKFFPDENILVEPLRFIRDQRIVRLKIFPLGFNPLRKILRRFDSITIKVDFVGGIKSYQEGTESQAFEKIFQNMLLNYQFSKDWRRASSGETKVRKEKPEDSIDPFSFSDQWYKIVVKEDGIYRLSQKELAEAAGIDQSYLSMIESGQRRNPGMRIMSRLAQPIRQLYAVYVWHHLT